MEEAYANTDVKTSVVPIVNKADFMVIEKAQMTLMRSVKNLTRLEAGRSICCRVRIEDA